MRTDRAGIQLAPDTATMPTDVNMRHGHGDTEIRSEWKLTVPGSITIIIDLHKIILVVSSRLCQRLPHTTGR